MEFEYKLNRIDWQQKTVKKGSVQDAQLYLKPRRPEPIFHCPYSISIELSWKLNRIEKIYTFKVIFIRKYLKWLVRLGNWNWRTMGHSSIQLIKSRCSNGRILRCIVKWYERVCNLRNQEGPIEAFVLYYTVVAIFPYLIPKT